MLPLLEATLSIRLSPEPTDRTVCGISSGGIAAFSAAWFQPDQFANVISHCGSYTNIFGGHHYPSMIQTTPRKPIKVFLQSGENDVHSPFGHWPTANQAWRRPSSMRDTTSGLSMALVATRCDMVERSSQMRSALSGRIKVDPRLPARASG